MPVVKFLQCSFEECKKPALSMIREEGKPPLFLCEFHDMFCEAETTLLYPPDQLA